MHVQGEEAIASNVLPYRPSFQTQNMSILAFGQLMRPSTSILPHNYVQFLLSAFWDGVTRRSVRNSFQNHELRRKSVYLRAGPN